MLNELKKQFSRTQSDVTYRENAILLYGEIPIGEALRCGLITGNVKPYFGEQPNGKSYIKGPVAGRINPCFEKR